jgi:hypothetical protein
MFRGAGGSFSDQCALAGRYVWSRSVYKGPLIFPLLALALMILASLPAAWRLITPQEGASWQLDDAGMPLKTIVVLGFLILFLSGWS